MDKHHAWKEVRGTAAGKVLLNAYEAGSACFKSEYGLGLSETSAIGGAKKLRDMGLAVSETSEAGELELTDLGQETAEIGVGSRQDGPDRWDAVQRALLSFVRDTKPSAGSDMVGSDAGVVDGRPVSKDEVAQAFEYLKDKGLLTSVEVWGASDIRPEITAQGRYAVSEPNIREYVERGFVSVTNDYSTNTTVSGSATLHAVTGGMGNTTTVTINANERTQILTLVDRVLDELPNAEETTELRSKMEDLRTELESPTASKPRLLARATSAMALAAGSEAGRSVIEWIGQIVTGLGG